MSAYRVKSTLVRTTLVVGLVAGLAATLQGCVLAVGAAAGGGALVATDRRTLGAQTEDREIQVKAISQLNDGLAAGSHVNVTVFNRRVLLTGEVPDDAAKQKAETIVRGINNVHAIVNELTVGQPIDFSSRTNDTYLEGRVKTALIAEQLRLDDQKFRNFSSRDNHGMTLAFSESGKRNCEARLSRLSPAQHLS